MALSNEEVIWIGRDNSIDLRLYADSTEVDLGSVTEIRLSVGSVVIASTDSAAGEIRWNQAGYDTGEIRILAGSNTALSTGRFNGALVVYDASNLLGVVWDNNIPIRVKSDPLSTA
jgi:hypothetical protein